MWQTEINGDTAVPIPPELLTLATGCLFATQPRPHMRHGEGPAALFTDKPAGQWWEEPEQCGAHKPGRKCFLYRFKPKRWHLLWVNTTIDFPEWYIAGLHFQSDANEQSSPLVRAPKMQIRMGHHSGQRRPCEAHSQGGLPTGCSHEDLGACRILCLQLTTTVPV